MSEAAPTTRLTPPLEHRRTYRIGYGFTVEFVYRASGPSVACQWSPAVPRLSGKGARARMLAGYTLARDDFHQDLAQLIAGNVLVVDLIAPQPSN